MMRYLVLALVVIGAAAPLSAHAAEHARVAAVVAMRSAAQPFLDTLTLRGRTEATRRVDIRAEEAGLVVSDPLLKGSKVEKGETLCRIKEGDRAAELAEALARLKEAEIEFEAAKRLADKGFGAEMTRNTKAAAQEAAKARVLRAEISIDHLNVRAPFAGVLESDTAELGALLQNGSICASIIALDPIKLVAFSPERSVDQLVVGAVVEGRLITGRRVTGEITHVARSADRDTRTYLVEALVDNDDLSIRDGMTVEMSVALSGAPAHLLPQAALTLNEAGELGVKLAIDDKAIFTPIEIVRETPEGVWVHGLDETADVIVVGQEFVADGQTITAEFMETGALR